ncbi:MAG TPA: hypothetical protein VMR75_02210 [Candidatus Saccharimonadales bacterium]|nr:hypothetical protein [Candidatus Saccharimonadales bacterium]
MSCSSTKFCVVVIEYGSVITYRNGIWSPPETVAENSLLYAVSCTEDGGEPFCVAIGYNYLEFTHFTMTYRHGVWSSPEDIPGNGFYTAVSCTKDSGKPFCVATEGEGGVMINRNGIWNSPENVAGESNLYSVSCIENGSEPFCVTVGYSTAKSSNIAVIYRHGTWSPPEDLVGGAGGGVVSCAKESFCIFAEHLGNGQTYNGSSWSSPVSGMIGAYSDGISCTPALFCAAVDGGEAAVYSGGTWTSEAIPGSGNLDSVSCVEDVGELLCVAVSEEGLAITYPVSSSEEPKEKEAEKGGGSTEGGGGGNTQPTSFTAIATASVPATTTATVSCPSGSQSSTATATASASASGSGSATSTVSQQDAQNKANAAAKANAEANAHAAAKANAEAKASGECKPTPITAATAFVLPSAKQCVSQRRFTIHVRQLPGITWVSAVIKINGRRVKTVKRSRISALISLVGLPKGTFVLSITAKASNSRTVTGTRTYHTCIPGRKHHYPTPKL